MKFTFKDTTKLDFILIFLYRKSVEQVDVSLINMNLWKRLYKEAATRGVLWKKVFLEILQNAQVFSCEFSENFISTFFTEHLWTTASSYCYVSK